MRLEAGEDVLIGRRHERAELALAAAAARDGRGTLILVSGEAGIGKTSLARQVIADTGLVVLEGRAYQGVPLPYGPLVAALRAHQAGRHDTLLADEPSAGHLALILPELGTPPPHGDSAALFEALRATIAAIARRQPAALFLDDLHWADHATLELLPALAGALEPAPLLIVGAFRSDEIPRGHPVRRLRADLRRAGRLRELTVEPLDQSQTAQLAARALGAEPSPALAAALYDRTEGVPFFVEELAGALATGGRLHRGADGLALADADVLPLPESVRDAVGLQAEGFPALARRVLDIAAVAGQEFDLDLVTALAGDDELGLAPLLDRGILVEVGPGRAAFRHALTREACYLDVPWSRRRALHRELAARLEACGAPSAVVAEHWVAGREQERARQALVAAAESSRRFHAYRDAGAAFRRALEMWPDGSDEPARRDLLERLAGCAELSGDLAEAARVWREAADARRQAGQTAEFAAAERRLAGVYELRGDWERALEARETAATAFAAAGQPAEAATERLMAAAHLRSAANYHAALALLKVARAEAERGERVDLLARILGHEGNVRARLGEGAAGLDLVRAGLALALEHNLAGPAGEVYQRLADALEHTGDYAAAKETYLQAFDYCRANAAEATASICLACLSVVLRQTGDWERAAAVCRDVLATASSPSHALTVAGGTLGILHALRGNARAARPLLLESAALAQRIELAAMEILSTWGLALIDNQNAAHESAIARCRVVLDRWERTEDRHYVVPVLCWAATYCAEHGADSEARACAAALATIAADIGQPEALAALAHALGETAMLDGDAEQAATQFGQALDLLRDRQLPLDYAQTERRAGNALALAGQREAGAARLTAAYRTARKLGARPLAVCIARDLAALGEPVERRLGRRAAGQLAHSGLTGRELEVLQLVAVGRTSREIGQQLYLSPRTVEMHVQGILAKLDCRSRAEATRKAAELGLLGQAVERGA
jgi:DNA-binding CsgD family transcriptional regulator